MSREIKLSFLAARSVSFGFPEKRLVIGVVAEYYVRVDNSRVAPCPFAGYLDFKTRSSTEFVKIKIKIMNFRDMIPSSQVHKY
jgi:hypothetical protein